MAGSGKSGGMTEDQIKKLEASKDPDVRQLVTEYQSMMKSPYLSTYLSRIKMFATLDAEINDEPPQIKGTKKDDSAFERALAYVKLQPELFKGNEDIKKLMLPSEQKEAAEKATSIIDEVRGSMHQEMKNGKT